MFTYDVLIVGGGAAGLSAALVLSRARRSVVVVDAGQPRNAPAAHMHGFLGSDGLPPADLLAAGRREILGYGAELVPGKVTAITRTGTGQGAAQFDVLLDDGTAIAARRLLVSTGLRDDVPDIPGLSERWGRDVLHCPYCHGFEVRDQPLGVIGGTSEAILHAQIIRQWSDDVVYFTNGIPVGDVDQERFRARSIAIVDGQIAQLVIEDDHLTGVVLVSGEVVPRAAVFVRPRFVPNAELLSGLGCESYTNGWTTTDQTGRTSVPGLWAAGNAVNPRAQVITAAGEGSAAAIAINNDLVEEDVATALAEAGSTH
ncbi:MAG TPA: NAD(P)/FAD-dependent oxidoreductase [Propionicimonas sp.]|jgi:thioredoxin reductase